MKPLEIHPARAKAKNPEDLWDDPTWFAEEKLDGWRFLMHFGGGLDRTYVTGRRMSKVSGSLSEKGLCAPNLWPRCFCSCPLDEVAKMAVMSSLPPHRKDCRKIGYTVLDGEVLAPINAPNGFRDLAGIMNVDPEEATKRIAEIGPPRFVAFDLLFRNGRDVRQCAQLERKEMLRTLIPSLQNPLISLVQGSYDKQSFYDRVVDSGGEGVILKDISAPYGEGWVKVKKYTTIDVVVTGFTDAKMGVTGKYLGLIGAALVSVYTTSGALVEVGRVSGMTDEVRVEMSENPGRWIGSVIEVAAQEFGKDRLRHPRFKRHRPEADPKHATYKKMMEDFGREVDRVVLGEQLQLEI